MSVKPLPPAPRQKRAEQTREKIVLAATDLFIKDGYHATSSKKIAKAAGIAVGTFYNHFADKKSLLFEIHRQHAQAVHDMIADKISRLLQSGEMSGRQFSRELVRQTLDMHSFSPGLHREISALAHTDPDFIEMTRRDEAEGVRLIIRVLEPMRDLLRVDDLEATAWVVAQSVEAVIHSVKIFGAPLDEGRLLDALGDMIHRLMFEDSTDQSSEGK